MDSPRRFPGLESCESCVVSPVSPPTRGEFDYSPPGDCITAAPVGGRNAGHGGDIVVIQPFRVFLNQVEDVFFIGLSAHIYLPAAKI
jgi:hypothetical protein